MSASRGRLIPLAAAGLCLAACGAVDPPATGTPNALSGANPAAVSTSAQLAAVCSGCHMAEPSAFASLEGLSEDALRQSLTTYAFEDDGTTVMHRIARGYTATEIDAISAYLGTAP